MAIDSMRIDCASIKDLFAIVWDQNKNGVLDAGDKLVSKSYEVYKLTEEDADPAVFARTLYDLTGRMTRLLKGAGVFSRNAYLAIAAEHSVDVGTLIRIGKTSRGTATDTADVAIDLKPHVAEQVPAETTQRCRDAIWNKNDAIRTLMNNWYYDDAVSLGLTAWALGRLEYAQTCISAPESGERLI